MTPNEHLDYQRKLNKETQTLTLSTPPDTDKLPLAERLHIFLAVFESGCSITQPPIGNGKAEECPECVRAFVDVVKGSVDDAIAAEPLKAMRELTTWAAGEDSDAGPANSKEGLPATVFTADECQALLDLFDLMANRVDARGHALLDRCGCTDEERTSYEKLKSAGAFYVPN
jgi:hypothetical protein